MKLFRHSGLLFCLHDEFIAEKKLVWTKTESSHNSFGRNGSFFYSKVRQLTTPMLLELVRMRLSPSRMSSVVCMNIWWQLRHTAIALSMVSDPPSDFGTMWSNSIFTPQNLWQMQHLRWQSLSKLSNSPCGKRVNFRHNFQEVYIIYHNSVNDVFFFALNIVCWPFHRQIFSMYFLLVL